MPEDRPSFLSKSEKKAVEQHAVQQRALALQSLESLASLLNSPEALIEGLRVAAPELATKIGHKTDTILHLLAALPLPAEAVEPVVVPTILEPEVQPEAYVAEEVETQAEKKQSYTYFENKILSLTDEKKLPQFGPENRDQVLENLVMLRGKTLVRANSLDTPSALGDLYDAKSFEFLSDKYHKPVNVLQAMFWSFFKAVKQNLPDNFTLSMLLEPMILNTVVPALEVKEPAPVVEEKQPELTQPTLPARPLPAPPTFPLTVVKPQEVGAPEKKKLSDEEYGLIFVDAIERPSIVQPAEWEEAALFMLQKHGSLRQLSAEEVSGLWDRVHYSRDAETVDTYKLEPTELQIGAMKKIQTLHFLNGKTRLSNAGSVQQDTAVRTFLNMSKGIQTLDTVFENLKKNNPHMTANLAQRYLVDGIIKLMYV